MSEVYISAGIAKGKKIIVPAGLSVRPPRNIVRQAVFNILGALVIDSNVLDLFAGSGSFGIEALSRGAKKAMFVEKDAATAKALELNLQSTGFSDSGLVRVGDSVSFLLEKRGAGKDPGFGLVFADPPYAMSNGPEFGRLAAALCGAKEALAPGATVVLHLEAGRCGAGTIDALPGRKDLRKYGRNLICFAYLP